MKFSIIAMFFITFINLSSCKKIEKKEKQSQSLKKPALPPAVPKTYCEKTFFCSYKSLTSEKAKNTLMYKQKAFLSRCNTSFSRMKKEVQDSFNKCISSKCGKEFQSCVIKSSEVGIQKSDTHLRKPDAKKNTSNLNSPIKTKEQPVIGASPNKEKSKVPVKVPSPKSLKKQPPAKPSKK